MARENMARIGRLGAAAVLALALGGCAGGMGGLFGGQDQNPPPANQQPGLIPGLATGVFGAVTPTPPGQAVPRGPVAVRCRPVDVREGTETIRTFNAGGSDDASQLRWQATIARAERECRSFDDQANYRVGVQGRVVLGPAGAPGAFTVPVRVAVLRGDTVVQSRLTQVAVTIPAGQTNTTFEFVVDDITVPREASDPLANLQIVVGFDPAPQRPQRQTRRRG